jgi:uncharacterized membrane protein
VPNPRDRSRVHEARVAGLAITLSVAALILVVVYLVGGYAHKVVIELVVPASGPAASAAGLQLVGFRRAGARRRGGPGGRS